MSITVTTGVGGTTVDVTAGAGSSSTRAWVIGRTYAADVGDGVETVYVVTHGLGSEDVIWQVVDNTTGGKVYDAGSVLNVDQIQLEFEEIPTVGQYRVKVKL